MVPSCLTEVTIDTREGQYEPLGLDLAPKLEALSYEGLRLTSLQQLTITCNNADFDMRALDPTDEMGPIPSSISTLTSLLGLSVSLRRFPGRYQLHYLPHSLTSLTTMDCLSLRPLPTLSQLQELSLAEPADILSPALPVISRQLPSLRRFNLGFFWDDADVLPDGTSQLQQIQHLCVQESKRMRQVLPADPDWLSKLTALTAITIVSCEQFQAVPEAVTCLTGLKVIWVTHCKTADEDQLMQLQEKAAGLRVVVRP